LNPHALGFANVIARSLPLTDDEAISMFGEKGKR
jgi:hypothetical protein